MESRHNGLIGNSQDSCGIEKLVCQFHVEGYSLDDIGRENFDLIINVIALDI
jgi:hypothetical protein